MTIALLALFVFGTIAALILARYYEPPPRLTVGRTVRLVLCVVALGLLSAVGLRDPLPVSVVYPIAAGVAAAMPAGVVVVERRTGRR